MALRKILRRSVLADIFKELLPLIIGGIFTIFLWKENLLLSLLFVALIVLVSTFSYKNGEEFILIFGILFGLIIEVLGVTVGYQTFTNPTFLGIPMWLPLAWGYGFVFMKRIGLILNNVLI